MERDALPAGTRGSFASSLGVPGRERLPRAERKLLAMQTLVYTVVERDIPYSALNFFTPGSWTRVSLPPCRASGPAVGVEGSRRLRRAVRRGVLEPGLLRTLEAAADRVLAHAASSSGPFDEAWRSWRPEPDWPVPGLLPEFRAGGRSWDERPASG